MTNFQSYSCHCKSYHHYFPFPINTYINQKDICKYDFLLITTLMFSVKSKISAVALLIIATILGSYLHLSSTNLRSQLEEVEVIPQKMFAGEVHYSRIPVEYWEHRIQMIKALGLNALSVYVMWNYHEVSKGNFDYQTGNKNLSKFLDLAEKYDMKVLFRPGPYVCAEWDFGGFPARLLDIDGLALRSNNYEYLEEVKIYFQSLVPIMKKHLNSDQNPNGSIVLLQIQNEYGFYGTDKTYIEALRGIWRDLSIQCEEYYVDVIQNILKCHWKGANIGINNGINQTQYNYARVIEPKGYLLGGQIYSGWLTHWYEDWQQKSIDKVSKEYGFLMEYNHSYSMYMVHGGTNFGLTAGANAFKQNFDYRGHVTSYDYDAPINQQGGITPKYLALRDLIKEYAEWDIPAIPEPIPAISIPAFKVNPVGKLLSNLGQGIKNKKPQPFESSTLQMYNQGIVVYETTVKRGTDYYKLNAHDYALIYLDGVFVSAIDRSKQMSHTVQINCKQLTSCKLDIVIQAMGHINFDHQMTQDKKGLLQFSDTKNHTYEWTMYKVPVDASLLSWSKLSGTTSNMTMLSSAQFTLSETGDTYLDMSKFNKGYVFVNGINLGRYWSVGPQKRLFCPGVWLKKGTNKVHVLEMKYNGVQEIEGKTTLKDTEGGKITIE